MKVSVIGLGTWQLGGEWGKKYSEPEVEAIFDEARSCDITLVDTAECYGDHLSERLVGRALRRDRERWVIATKFGHRYTVPFEREQLWGVDDVRKQLEDSLRALAVDVIDLYQFHSGQRGAFENDALWSMLEAQKKAGKIRHIGISISSSIPREEQERQASRARAVGAECVQVVYNRLQRLPEDGIFTVSRKENLGVLARVPLASGFLSGKYRAGATFGPDDNRSKKSAEEIDHMAAEAARIQKEEVPPGTPMAAWALAWCLRNPAVTAVIPGCKDPAQVMQNAAAANLLAGAA